MATPRDLSISVEVDGEHNGGADFVFRLAGDPIPLLPTTSPPLPLRYLQSPPARPLVISNIHDSVLLAHGDGFMVVRTGLLVEETRSAKTRCVQDCCVADLSFPGVSLLSLSADESLVAACAGSEARFFSLIALLTDKDVQPSSSFRVQKAGAIQELKWLTHASRDYVVLSNDGLLSVGRDGNDPVAKMENVDAVDCCKNGSYIAVSRRKSLVILSSDFEEECCITLFSQMWSNEINSEAVKIKVDFIGWVRDDSIVVGCTQLNKDGKGEGYLVQVIRSGKDTFFEVGRSSSSGCELCFTFISYGVSFLDVSFTIFFIFEHACIFRVSDCLSKRSLYSDFVAII
uniref:Uncharacterized protein n=1 Tax=Avena sativa TaxID=4498 RepID=A0ACD5W6E6_AVESA